MFIDIVPVDMVRVTGLDGGEVTYTRRDLESGRVRIERPVVAREDFVERRVVLCEADGVPIRVAVVGPYDPDVYRRWVRFGVPAVWVR